MTLVEVVVALCIVGFVAASIFSLAQSNQRRTLANFYRLEAYRLAQTIVEHSMQVAYPDGFTPASLAIADSLSATQWTGLAPERGLLRPSSLGTKATQFSYPDAGGVVFTKTVTAGASIGSALVLHVTISWTFHGTNYSIELPVVRGA